MATKHNGKNIAITRAAGRAGQIALPGIVSREFDALEQAMQRSLAGAGQVAGRSLHIVSAPGRLRGIFTDGNVTVRIEDSSFSLSTREGAL